MTDKIDQLFKVPNNEEGAFFISMLRKYATDGIHVRVRGRKPNHKKADKLNIRISHQSVPIEIADELGIYLQYDSVINGLDARRNIGMATLESGIRNSLGFHGLHQRNRVFVNRLRNDWMNKF